MAPPPHPTDHSRVLEIILVSAEDIAPVSKNMKTYAVAWVHQDGGKIATGVDQTGGRNPAWNEKLIFQVDDKFLNLEDAAIVVEIYAAAWGKDALIGHVNVSIKDIFRLRSAADTATMKDSSARIVSLQIHCPSGRPQGILNMQVSLLHQLEDPKQKTAPVNAKINRSQMDRTDLAMEDKTGSLVNYGSGSSSSRVKGNGSMVNGDSLCSSDVGPSASVVAAAIAKGLYNPPVNHHHQAQSNETSIKIKEWTEKEKVEHLERKLERWRSEIPPLAAAAARNQKGKSSSKGRRSRGKKNKSSSDGSSKKLFSCFGNAFGFEISITCGGGKRKKHGNGDNKITHLSSVDDNYSQSVV